MEEANKKEHKIYVQRRHIECRKNKARNVNEDESHSMNRFAALTLVILVCVCVTFGAQSLCCSLLVDMCEREETRHYELAINAKPLFSFKLIFLE